MTPTKREITMNITIKNVGLMAVAAFAGVLWAHGQVSAQEVQFRLGEESPAFAISPVKPTTCDFVAFQAPLDGRTISNACIATWATPYGYGGTPALKIDQEAQTIDLGFGPPSYEVCGQGDDPVNGVKGSFGRLSPGTWTYHGYGGSQYSFDVVACGLTTITLLPGSKGVTIDPKSGVKIFDPDGLGFSAYWVANVTLSAFKVRATVGKEIVEVAFPGPFPDLKLTQEPWIVVDPVGCMDDDPTTECHPTSIARYVGGTEDVPVSVRPTKGKGERHYYAKVSLEVEVTIIDGKVAAIDGGLGIGKEGGTGVYEVPIVGRVPK